MRKWRSVTWWLLAAAAFWAVVGVALFASIPGWDVGHSVGYEAPGIAVVVWVLGAFITLAVLGLAWILGRIRSPTPPTAESRIRRHVYDLTSADLERYPIWEFALDEEGDEGQDEATVRPVVSRDLAHDFDVVRTTFVAADGTVFTGYVTPDPSRNPGLLQPTIVTEGGQVNFWFGWQEQGVTDAMVRPLYDLLGKSPDDLFPISYRTDLPWRSGSESSVLEDQVTGFGWLAEPGSDETQEMR